MSSLILVARAVGRTVAESGRISQSELHKRVMEVAQKAYELGYEDAWNKASKKAAEAVAKREAAA